MKKVLIYIEPHPIRNYYEEFHDVGILLCRAMYCAGHESGYDFRFFANDAVTDRIITSDPNLSYLSLRMNAEENIKLSEFYHQWSKETIDQWTSLVRGDGQIADFYIGTLCRIHKEYKFDAVLLWSDNGAVRKFCKNRGIIVLHAEYGPTRPPFHKTIYFDLQGTNGSASVINAPIEQLTPKIIVPSETWVTRQGKKWNHEKEVGLIDAPLTTNIDFLQNFDLPHPYAFIPLQLEDDLNTQLHSNFKTPEEFLRNVVPRLLELGLNIVIKGHPAAPGRPYNLIAETKAINYAKSLGDRVKILPRDTPAFNSIMAITQSTIVITINSSVGFEALLLGKPVQLYGAAMFDIGRKINSLTKALETSKEYDSSQHEIEKLTSFLCNHYLHPIESVTNGKALISVLDYIFRQKEVPTESKEFWEGWIESIDFGYQWLTESNEKPKKTNLPAAGNRAIFEAQNRTFESNQSHIHIYGKKNKKNVSAFALRKDDGFIGYIDSIETITENNNSYIQINGWCLERNGLRPPIQILFCEENEIISQHRSISPRRDVSEALNLPIATRCGFTFRAPKKHVNSKKSSLIIISSSNYAQIINLRTGSIHPTSDTPLKFTLSNNLNN